MLEKACGEFCPSVVPPVVVQDALFHVYNGPVSYSWPTDPYAKGSYSYIAAGQESLLISLVEIGGENSFCPY